MDVVVVLLARWRASDVLAVRMKEDLVVGWALPSVEEDTGILAIQMKGDFTGAASWTEHWCR